MKSLRRGSAFAVAAAAAIGAAYVGWTGSVAYLAKGAPPASAVEAVALVGPSGGAGRAADPPAPDVFGATDVCPFCLAGTDPAASEAEPPDGQEIFVAGLADFDESLNGLPGLAPEAAAAPASEISTAAMVTLGLVALTAWRRKGRARWAAPWRLSAAAQSG